jgi:NADH-quinone oxidoreductase subunit N
MQQEDFLYLTPLIIIAGMPVLIMVIMTFTKNFPVIFGISILGLCAAILSVLMPLPELPHIVSSFIRIDAFSIRLNAVILIGGLFITLLSYDFLHYQEGEKTEYLIVIFVALLGTMLLTASVHFISFFLGLETLSIALFILIAYRKSKDQAIEASVKYFVLASVSSAFLLFGMGLIYVGTGELSFPGIASDLAEDKTNDVVLLAGFGMMMVGLGFKLALVPFHMWTPDVYQGAPAPVSAFIATVSKGSVIAVLYRFFYELRLFEIENLVVIISVISVLSMFTGNLLAIRQNNVKRILAYSSISNLGYLMIPLLTGDQTGLQALMFYVVSYIFTTLGAFGVVAVLSGREREAEMIADYRGLFWKQPVLAIVFTVMLLSLAGIPLTAGFMAKFYVVFAGIGSNLWLLVISLAINSVIGLYYYLRIVVAMFLPKDVPSLKVLSFTASLVLILLTAGILWMGVFPQQLLEIFAGISSF